MEVYLKAIDTYFSDGGKAYTHEELSNKLMNDVGGVSTQKDIDMIIENCLDKGYIYDCGNNCYVR